MICCKAYYYQIPETKACQIFIHCKCYLEATDAMITSMKGEQRMSILKIESLCKYYGNKKNETKALDGISLEVQTGEFLGIMGSTDPENPHFLTAWQV